MKNNKDIEAKRLGNSVKGPEHTPTPWKQLDNKIVQDNGSKYGAVTIAHIYNDHIGIRSEADANAALIVRAVNSYNSLVEDKERLAFEATRLKIANDALLEAAKLARHKLAMWPEGSNPEFFSEVKALDKAIAQVEGK